MEGNRLTIDETEKDLGIWISPDMKCSDHCLYAFNKASKVMGMIKRSVKYKEARIMVSLYKTLVRPHVEYCVLCQYVEPILQERQGAAGKGSMQVYKNDYQCGRAKL